jgi:hypothetical protein
MELLNTPEILLFRSFILSSAVFVLSDLYSSDETDLGSFAL